MIQIGRRKPTTFATTMNYMRSQEFASRVCYMVKRPAPGRLSDGIRIFLKVIKAALSQERLLLSSSWGSLHPELLAAATLGFLPNHRQPTIYLLGCMWEPDRGLRGSLERLVVKLADRSINCYIVQSTEELTIFPQVWGIAKEKLRFCPFFFSITENDMQLIETMAPNGEHIFAGGNSLRDYEPLVEAARCMPERKFIFATKLLDGRNDLPSNVEARQVSHQQFVYLMYSSAATVVPIQPGLRRAAGQQTYLNAMWLEKPTIVNDTLGVRDHIRNKETGLIVDGSAPGYVEALNWVFSPKNKDAVALMKMNARKEVEEKFSFDSHIHCLLSILDEDQ